MTSRVPITIVTTLAIVSLCACSQSAVGDEVWGIDRAEFAARLASGDRSLLETLPAEHHDPAEILRLGDDAAYAVGVISGDLERLDASAALLTVAWQRSPEPYRRAALVHLADRLRASGAHEELERLAVEAHSVYPDDLEVLVLLSGSIYLQADHRRVLDVTGAYAGAYAHSVAQLPADSPVRQEFALQRAVSRALIWSEEPDAPEASDWQASFRALYADFPASPIHSRLWVFLIRQEAIRAAFTVEELRFFQAKQLVSEGRSREALDVLLPLARAVAAASAAPSSDSAPAALGDLILGRHGIADLFRAGLAAGSADAARVLEALAVRVAPAAAGQTLEYAGRIYRVAGAHAAAIRVFSEALELGDDPTARQALLWYRLSSTVRLSPVDAVTRLAEALPLVATPASFSAVFLDLADRLIALEEWRALQAAYDSLSGLAEPGVLARFELALANAISSGAFALPAGRAEELRARYLAAASAQTHDVFAALIAATLRGGNGVEQLGIATDAPPAAVPPGDALLLTETFLRYSMLDRLVSHLRASGDRVGPDARRRAAELLASRGEWSKSIVALNWYETTGGAFTADVARLRYPEAFADEFDAAVRVEPVDPWVFYALVREESLFDPVVASGAGAVGLAQLMPSTAQDIARRLRLTGYELTSASDSVRIGARYFGMLTDQFGTASRALAAYNAGQGNVRRWERLWPYADDLLFHQLIPFPETYNHVRKVVVSAAYYGYLYAGRTPADTVRLVFGLKQSGHLSGARDIDR